MSNTVITSYTDISGNISKPGKQLVVVVNKDGTVSFEKSVFQSLLDDKGGENTSVSLVHINEDGKPTDASDDSSDDETVPHVNLTVNAFYDADTCESLEKGALDEYLLDSTDYFLIGFRNDHCYTPLSPPDPSRVLDIPNKERTVESIPVSKKITIIENKIIPKDKKFINLNTADAQIILRRSDILKKIVESQKGNHNLISLSNKTALNTTVENTVPKLETEKLNPLTEKTSESSSESLQDDRDSDSDYHSRSRKTPIKPNKPKTVINKNVKSLLSKKIELKKNISNIHHSDIPPQYKHAKTYKVKSFSKTNNARHIVTKKLKKNLSPKNDAPFKVDNRQSHGINDIRLQGETDGSKEPAKADLQKHVKPIPKKDKKPPAHVTALLNDMTSLFSTPDVIRRISTENKQSAKTPDRISTNVVFKKLDKDIPIEPPIITSTPNKISADLSKIKSETKTYSNTSSKTIQKNLKDINQHLASKAGRDSIDAVGPLGDANITQLYQDAHSALLPLHVEGNLGSMTGKLEPICTNVNNILMSPTSLSGSNLNAPLSPGLDLLGGIHPEEEGLTEDLLMHVAQLVESSENLQEVIDKQVLGKVSDVPPKNVQASPGVNSLLSKIDNIPIHLLEKPTVSSPQPRKEPIQIVRSNGRVITLPPIEAPATRSSKRKSLLNASSDQPSPVVAPAVTKVSTPSVQAPVLKQTTQGHKKGVHKSTEHSAPSQRKPDGDDDDNVESDESWNSEDDPDRLWCICKQPHNNRFMICCDLCEDWFHGKCVNITKVMGQEMEEKGVEWRCPNCLKKKSVAKPNSPRKSIDSRSEAVMENETYLHLPTNANKNPAQSGNTNCIVCKKSARASSIYCSDICILKHAQESLNPMTSGPANTSNKVQTGRPIPSDKTNPETRVIVYERETGKCLAGPSAPTAANLKVWLQENPTFEVVQPGTINRPTINIKARTKSMPKIQSVLKVNQDKQVILMQPPKGSGGGNSTPNKNQPAAVQKPLTPKTLSPKVQPSTTLKPPTPKSLSLKLVPPKDIITPKPPIPKLQIIKQPTVKPGLKSPPTPKTPTSQQKQPPLKSPPTPTYARKDDSKRMYSTEPIRENVRKTLQEQLSLRMSETKDIKFTSDEIHKFAVDTEHELHDLFKDVGTRYKAKYRSLMFNLKDRKNLSLWKKICDHSITPKQLVRLSAEELASQELAQWRDQEVKHQLELIKKSELDLLACSKTYVLKTHKGEEVIESRTTDTTELDPNVTLEDIVSALNHVPGEEKLKDEDKAKDRDSHSPSPSHHHRHHSHLSHHKHSKHKSRSHSKSSKSSHKKDHSSEINKVSSEKHESSRESKSTSRSRHRKNSKDRVKSHTESKHHERSRKSSHSEHHTSSKSKNDLKESPDRKSRKRSHSRDVSNARSSSKEPDKRRSSSSSKEGHKHRSSSKESEIKHNTKKTRIEDSKDEYSHNFSEKLSSPPDLTSTHIDPDVLSNLDDGDIFVPQENIDIDSPPTPGTPEILENQQLSGADSDQEPSSTVDSIWSGCVSMIDVAKFNVSAFEVSGHCDYITKDLVPELEIVGRISPEIVWEYINKMKKQGNKDIMVIKLMPSNEEEKIQYNVFFSYLNSRNRLGVVRAHGGIKDFYVLPLTSHAPLPSVLLPLKGPGFDEPRPHLLLGIIVGQKKKRSSSHISSIPSKISKLKEATERSYTPPPTSSYTPPSSPRRSLPTLSSMPLPSFLPSLSNTVKSKIAASLASADDEPYSPGGSDSVSQSPPQAGSSDLQRKMEELNRKIEEQKKQIQNMAVNINSNESLDEPYSPSRPMSPETSKAPLPTLSSISLPSNLHEILASIQKQTKPPGTEDGPIQESYVPTAISINMTSVTSTYYRDGPANDVDMRVPFSLPPPGFSQEDMPAKSPSKLASLSEAELLSMVPDDEVLQSVFPPLPAAPPPLPQTDMSIPPPPYKKKHRLDLDQPPPPGLEDNSDD